MNSSRSKQVPSSRTKQQHYTIEQETGRFSNRNMPIRVSYDEARTATNEVASITSQDGGLQ